MRDLEQGTETTPPPKRRIQLEYGSRFWLRLLGLGLLDALAVYSAIVLAADGAWVFLAFLIVGTLFVNWVYLWPGTRALRWITPGLIFTVAFLVVPILYTFFISFTNWSTGNILNKAQAIEVLESRAYVDPDDPGELFDLHVYRDDETGEIRFLLIAEDGRSVFGEPRLRTDPPLEDGAEDVDELGATDADGDGIPEMIGPYLLLSTPGVFQLANQLDFDQLVIDIEDGEVQITGLSQGRVVLSSQQYVYDADTDVMFDTVNQKTCIPGETTDDKGNFICEDGQVLVPGWVAVIGVDNYASILTNENIRGPFFRVFIWNMVFATLSVLFSFALGLLLAIAIQHERFRGRAVFRSLYILPYAIPAGLSVLIWRGLLNEQFGQVNDLLANFGIDPVPWLTDPTWAKISLLLVNTWLSFTYMFLISTGALQSIPVELPEAARVDGASGPRVFREITFPLLMVSLAPLLIGSFAFAFNNFLIIFLLTNGGPPIVDAAVPVGSTDILITFTFDLAITGGRGNQFGLAAAVTVLIFIIVAVISAISFRFTRRLEDIYGSL
jgi:ABC-type sugar transport system permease subunit